MTIAVDLGRKATKQTNTQNILLKWSYGYICIDPKSEVAAPAIENIADAVTHARFVGTDPGSDEVVLMKILHVSKGSTALLYEPLNYHARI